MKKEYVSPRITVMEMESTVILAGSEPQIGISEDWASDEDEVL